MSRVQTTRAGRAGSSWAWLAVIFSGALTDTLSFTILRRAGWSLEWAAPASFGTSIIVVYVLSRIIARRRLALSAGAELPPVLVYLTSLGLSYFLTAGLLAALVELLALPEMGSAAVSAVVGWGAAVGSWPLLGREGAADAGWLSGLSLGFVASCIGFTFASRMLFLILPELLHQEAYYWAFARFPDLSYLDHPPLAAWTIWITTRALGHTELGVRAGAFAAWLVAAGFVHALTRRLYDRRVAWGATLLVAALPAYFMIGWTMSPDAPLVACWAAAIYFLCRALIDGKTWAWLGVGIAFGLGMLAKYTMGLLGVAGLVFILGDRNSRRWLVSPAPYLAALLATAIFSPVIVWNARNDWISIWWQTGRRVTGSIDFDLPDLLGAVLMILTPAGLASLLSLMGRPDRSRRFLLTLALVPMAVFAFFSLGRNIKVNWAAPVWLAALPLLAVPLMRGVGSDSGRLERWAQSAWRPTLVALLLIYGAGLHYMGLGFAGLPYGLNETGLGWRDMGVRFEKVVDEAEAELGSRPLVVGMDKDRIPAWLAFYRSRALALRRGEISSGEAAATTGGDHLLGGKGGFYRWHLVPERYAGQPMILVGHRAEHLDRVGVRLRSERLGPIREIEARKNGRVTSRYYYRRLFGYRPLHMTTPK